MPTTDMLKKYLAKYHPETVGSRIDQVSGIARERLMAGASQVDAIRKVVTPILDAHGIGGGQRGAYLSFSLKLSKHISRQRAETITDIALGLEDYFETAYGLDRAILDEIVSVLTAEILFDLWEVGMWEISEWCE